MNGISSYALKTVVMNMITENPNKDWKPSQKAELFLEVSGGGDMWKQMHAALMISDRNFLTIRVWGSLLTI